MILIRHGWHGIYALRCLIEEYNKEDMFRSYVASMAGMMTRMMARFGGQNLEIPSYLEMIGEGKQEDRRSAEEIKNHVLALFSQ